MSALSPAAAAAVLLFAAAAAAVGVAIGRGNTAPVVVGDSVVRIDATTLEPTDVVPVGGKPDLVVVAGGFLWVTHHVLRDVDSGALRNAGDRTLTRTWGTSATSGGSA